MKATRNDFLKVFNILFEVKGKQDKTFGMYVNLNKKKLQPVIEEIQTIQESAKPSEEFLECGRKEIDLLKQYAVADKDGNIKPSGKNLYPIKPEYVDVYKMAKDQLMEEYKEVLQKQKELSSEVDRLMNEEVECEVSAISFSVFPEEFDIDNLGILQDFGLVKDFEV